MGVSQTIETFLTLCSSHPYIGSRRVAWNATLVIGGIFGIAAAASPNFVVFCTMVALIGQSRTYLIRCKN